MFRKMIGAAIALVLVVVSGATVIFAQVSGEATRVGEVVLLSGHVLDVNGNPVEGAVVEIWQTDANGVYNHPNDPGSANLVNDFQYFGSSVTDADGAYSFRTIKPALYEAQRPPHIHVKIKINDAEVLTTQLYFEEDRDLFESDGVFTSSDSSGLVLQPEDSTDDNGNPVRLASMDFVVATPDAGGSGSLPLTVAQTEGPYYPVVSIEDFDSDLTVVGEPMAEFTLWNLNTASGDDFKTIPGVGDRMVREFQEYRPYISIVQFRREIGKYVDDAQVAAYEAYVYVPIDVDASDAETLKQIPGVDDEIANALIAARPFGSNEAFLTALAGYVSEPEAAFAANYLAAE